MNLDLSYLSYPLPPDIQRLFEAGDFDRMARVIALRLADPRTPKCLHERLRFQLTVANDITRAYPYTQEEVLSILRKEVKDFKDEELEVLRDDGTIDWRYVNGEVRFKDNGVPNLLNTRKEYLLRATDPDRLSSSERRTQALDAVIERMKQHGGLRARFEVREEMTIKSDRLTPGETLRIHLPLPCVYAQVKSAQLLASSHAPTAINSEDELQRSAYFELPYEPGMTVWCDLAYEIDAPYVDPDFEQVAAEQPDFDTGELAPHIVFTPFLRALAKEIVGEETNPLKKAHLIYDFITTQCVYRYMPAYRTVMDIPEYFVSGQRGDCGVQAITFITLCRLCGIPAQWQAGLYTTPETTGNHDWARFYVAPYGWLYCDCSFGGSAHRAANEVRRDFYFANLEPWRLPLCRDFQQEFNPPKKFLRRDPYDNQNGEIESLQRALESDEYNTSSQIIRYTEL